MAYAIKIFNEKFSCQSSIAAEKITFYPLSITERRTDKMNYRVAPLLNRDEILIHKD